MIRFILFTSVFKSKRKQYTWWVCLTSIQTLCHVLKRGLELHSNSKLFINSKTMANCFNTFFVYIQMVLLT